MPRAKQPPPNPHEPMYERNYAVVVCPREHYKKYAAMMFDDVAAAAKRGEDGLVLSRDGAPNARPGEGFCSFRMINHPGLSAHGKTGLVEQRW